MKKVPLTRTKGLKRTEFKRKPYEWKRNGKLRAKAPVSKRRRIREAEQYQAPEGVPFDEVPNHLPNSVAAWPQCVPVLNRPKLRTEYLAELRGTPCPLCGKEEITEVHHLNGGGKGRADERCNFLALGAKCHREIQSQPDQYQRCWRAKREQDPDGCNWVRLIQLLGRWPTFETLD